MSRQIESEPRNAEESGIAHDIQNMFGYWVHFVCEVDHETAYGHLVHDLEVAEESLRKASQNRS